MTDDRKYDSPKRGVKGIREVRWLFFFFFETFLFILDYILRPRSVLPPVPVEDLCSAYIGICLQSVLISYVTLCLQICFLSFTYSLYMLLYSLI